MSKLRAKRELFCQEYLIDCNATQAAMRAGYSPKTANEQGARLLANVSIQSRISELMKERSNRTLITQDRVLQELSSIAFARSTDFGKIDEIFDIIGYVKDEDGNEDKTKPIVKAVKRVIVFKTKEIPPESIPAIAQIKETKEGISIKLYDKLKALEARLMERWQIQTDLFLSKKPKNLGAIVWLQLNL